MCTCSIQSFQFQQPLANWFFMFFCVLQSFLLSLTQFGLVIDSGETVADPENAVASKKVSENF